VVGEEHGSTGLQVGAHHDVKSSIAAMAVAVMVVTSSPRATSTDRDRRSMIGTGAVGYRIESSMLASVLSTLSRIAWSRIITRSPVVLSASAASKMLARILSALTGVSP
jgi:hypothetical protein